jgi:hypothetical protein
MKTVKAIIWIAIVLTFLCILGSPPLTLAALSDAAALKKAKDTWGTFGYIGMERDTKQGVWTKFVGFKSTGCKEEITKVGIGQNTWDAAFAAAPADQGIGGRFGGTSTLKIQTGAVSGAQGPLYPNAVGFQWMIDGLVFGPAIGIPAQQTAWELTTPWDTTKYTAGPHVVCGAVLYANGQSSLVRAAIVIVDQTAPANAIGYSRTLEDAERVYTAIRFPEPIPQMVQPLKPTPPLPDGIAHAFSEWPPK